MQYHVDHEKNVMEMIKHHFNNINDTDARMMAKGLISGAIPYINSPKGKIEFH